MEANPSTGFSPATGSTTWPSIPTGQSAIARRVQIKATDLDPAQNAGAVYVAECQYVHPQDAANNNDNNNASYRLFTVQGLSSGAYTLSLTGSTFQQKPAIFHWVTVVPSVAYSVVDMTDGRFVVGYNVTPNANGTYHYEYAIYNMNSDSSGGSFSVPIPAGVTVTNATFKDIAYHSGEPYDSTDWTITNSGGQLRWQCTQTFAQNVNANALRFGTLFNFAFDASGPGVSGDTTLGVFKTGASIVVRGLVPANPCRVGDLDCNGIINGADLGSLLANWGPCPGGVPGCVGDLNNNGIVDGGDLGSMLSNWG